MWRQDEEVASNEEVAKQLNVRPTEHNEDRTSNGI